MPVIKTKKMCIYTCRKTGINSNHNAEISSSIIFKETEDTQQTFGLALYLFHY